MTRDEYVKASVKWLAIAEKGWRGFRFNRYSRSYRKLAAGIAQTYASLASTTE